MTTSFFNGESTFPENNTTDQLVDALTAQLNITDAASQAAQDAATLAVSSAANAAISETNVAGLSQQANDTLAQANAAITAANTAATGATAAAAAAASSATAAAASATTSGTAAGQASVSEVNAAASASAASASQTAASGSASAASASASAALASKNAAATSETNAGTSATSATSSKNAAATSASNAATSETNANTSKNAAATSATNAATSEGNAATSATAAAASATLAQNQTAYLSGRNRVIGGCMRVQQRTSTTVASGANGFGPADRMKCINNAGSGVFTVNVASLTDVNGVAKPHYQALVSTVFSAITGSNSAQAFVHIFEGLNVEDLIGKQVTLSFQLRGSVAGTYAVSLRDSTSSVSCVKTFSLAATGTEQLVTLTFPAIPSGAVIPNSNAQGLVLTIGAVGGATITTSTTDVWQSGNFVSTPGVTNWLTTVSNALNITEVQLEAGTVATPFERRPYPLELLMCQRYYLTGRFFVAGSASYLGFPASMRTSMASASISGGGTGFTVDDSGSSMGLICHQTTGSGQTLTISTEL